MPTEEKIVEFMDQFAVGDTRNGWKCIHSDGSIARFIKVGLEWEVAAADLDIHGPLTVTREVKRLEPFETMVAYFPELNMTYIPAVGQWPKGTRVTVYEQGTEPTRLVPEEVRQMAQDIVDNWRTSGTRRRKLADWVLSQVQP